MGQEGWPPSDAGSTPQVQSLYRDSAASTAASLPLQGVLGTPGADICVPPWGTPPARGTSATAGPLHQAGCLQHYSKTVQ